MFTFDLCFVAREMADASRIVQQQKADKWAVKGQPNEHIRSEYRVAHVKMMSEVG